MNSKLKLQIGQPVLRKSASVVSASLRAHLKDRLDTIGRAAFSYDFDCLSGNPHALAEALDGLTNSEHNLPSFYMRALFWILPSILRIGKKGEMIKRTKRELGKIALKMWRDAKVVCNLEEEKSLMASMRMGRISPICVNF